MTLLPRGSEEGKTFQPDQIFSFDPILQSLLFLTSHVRLHDQEGDLIDIDPLEMQPLPPIQTILRFGRKQMPANGRNDVPVRLGIRLTAIGTVEMWLDSQTSEHRWQLEFQLKFGDRSRCLNLKQLAKRQLTKLLKRDIWMKQNNRLRLFFNLDSTLKAESDHGKTRNSYWDAYE